MAYIESHLLTLVTFLPVLGAILIALLPRGEGGQHKGIAFLFSLLTFLLSIALWTGFRAAPGRYSFEQKTEWAPALGFSYHIGLDGVALLLFLLTTFLGPIVVLSSWKFIQERVNVYCIALLLLETAILGTLASLDLVLFYVFWEAMLIPMYLLIGMWGSDRRIYAAVKFFLFTFIGSVLMLLAIFWLWSNSGRKSFDYAELLNAGVVDVSTQRWLFLAFALAFAIKVPIWPLHTWLPDAHTEAPAAGSIILAGVMLKMGTFGFIRYAMPLFPQAALAFAPAIAVLGVIGIVYGSLMCMAQTDLKRLIAYSSVAHLGFVMLGLSALTPEAVSGAVLQMVNHGISTGALFLMVGYLYERTHTRDLAAYGGLATVAPAIAATFLVITLSSIGLPGTNGFVGEFLVLIGTFTSRVLAGAVPLAVIGATGVILGAVYMLWLYQRVFFGPPRKAAGHGLQDLTVREWFTVAPLLLAIVVLGIAPQPLLSAIKEPVDAVVQRVSRADRAPPVRKAEAQP
ncbi:MAG: NADH dehydrogenase [Deltaproteobacteria bacterium 13_1_40CM_3_69_14]|nr:MAG: NADH dehydrogenase [Deltaproteobacteria bacterium 13_1_40CM_3_69_14]